MADLISEKIGELAELKTLAEEHENEYLAEYYDEKIQILRELSEDEKF